MELIIDGVGRVKCVYDEAIDLSALGQLQITRASHVEPDESGTWWADMSPVGGPKLGPFEKRSDALGAEGQWLLAHVLSCTDHART